MVAVVAAAAVWALIRPNLSTAPPRRSFLEDLGLTERVRNGVRAHPVLSPDGTRLVYAIQLDGTTELYTRSLEELKAHPMPGTNGAYHPFFSPDGEWVGFFTSAGDQQLQKVSIRGGQPQPLCDACEAPAGGGATWGSDDTIVFSTQGPDQQRLFRLSLAEAGAPQVLTSVDREQGERAHLAPHILPGGDSALFTISMRRRNPNEARIAVVSLETGTYRTLIERGYNARYVPSGHVVFVRAGELWAVPFDRDRSETTGPEALILEGMQWDSRAAAEAPFAFSDDGLLVYVPGADVNAGAKSSLVWVDRQGREEMLPLEPARYSHPQVSPDGSRVAVAITDDSPLCQHP